MEQKYINSQELSNFVEEHNLRNRVSIIHFNALITIKTAKNLIKNERVEVMISFDNFDSYGDLKFLTGDFDPYLYPTVFEAKWQKMQHKIDHLIISGNHTQNPDIGKYEVKVVPLEKIRD